MHGEFLFKLKYRLFLWQQELIFKREQGVKAQQVHFLSMPSETKQAQEDERRKERDTGEKKEKTNKKKENGERKWKGEDE